MHSDISRRAALRLSATAGAAGLAAPLLASTANAATANANAANANAANANAANANAANAATGNAVANGAAPATPTDAASRGCRQDADRAADRIIASIRRPLIRGRDLPLGDFGGTGDGTTDNTAAFAAAIAAANRRGGGRVVVPPGSYASGPIHLLSNVELRLEAGATILFSTNPEAYLPVVYTRWQGIECMNYSPLVYAYGQHDIAITGEGVLDGQAATSNWWAWKSLETPGFNTLQAMADDGVPVTQRLLGDGYHLPPPMIQPYRCDRVLIQGVTIRNSPFWHMNPTLSTSVVVDGVTVSSTGPNTDGCDPECCDGVLITGVTFDTGDDCIAIKAGRNTDGRRVNVPCQNIVIQNCSYAAGHGGVTVGSEMTGGVRNVYARDLTMTSQGLQAGHRIKTNSVRGGFVENTNVYRVTATAVGGPVLLIDYNYGEGNTGTYPPLVTDVNLTDWTVTTCVAGWDAAGYATDEIGTIRLTDVIIATMTGTNTAQYVADFELDGVTIAGKPVTTP